MGRILVTGATGLIGNNLVRLLCARGDSVRVLVRAGSDPRPLAGLPVERVVGDVRDAASVARSLVDASLVYHCAAMVGIGTSDLAGFRAVNVGGTQTVARAALAAGARMVHVSSVDALGYGTRARPATEESPPDSGITVPYVVTKREAERAVLELAGRGLDAVIANPVFVLGRWDWKPSSGRMLLEVARGAGRIASPGGNDFAHAEDVAEGIARAAERGRRGERYILGGEALSYRDAFTLFAQVTGGAPPLATAPAFLVRAAGWGGTLVGRLTGREPALNAASAALGCLPHHFDDAKARRELDYRSRSAREAADDAWQWLVDQGYVKNQNADSNCRARDGDLRA